MGRAMIAVLAAALLWAPQGNAWLRPERVVPVVTAPPAIDGVLSDPAWQEAAVIEDLLQVEPMEGAAPSERTRVLLARDEHNLYIAVRCGDREPQAIVAKVMQRDKNGGDDRVQFVLDGFGRQREGYYFQLTPAGAKLDALVDSAGAFNVAWDSIWLGQARVDGSGWTAEFAIPFKSLAFDPVSDAWGFNVSRYIARKQETARWSYPFRSKGVTALDYTGVLHGFAELQQGLGLDLKPALTVKRSDNRVIPKKDNEARPSFDAVYRITPALAATVTVNTDFAETEDDSRVINLSRFPLFFPEKRDFFLEDATVFSFADGSITPFFSRRIGLNASGQPVDIEAGAKLTGRAGRWSIGLLDAQTGASGALPRKNLAAGRLAYQPFGESSAGLIATRGDPRGDFDNTTAGADFTWRNSNVTEGKSISSTAYYVQTDSEFAGARDDAFGLSLNYPNDPLSFSLSAREIGANWDPALGFVARTGIRSYSGNLYRYFRPSMPWVREWLVGGYASNTTDLHGRGQDGYAGAPDIYLTFKSGDQVGILYQRDYERLNEPFEIAPGVVVPAGKYQSDNYYVSFVPASSRPLSGSLIYGQGDRYTGNYRYYLASLIWRPSSRISTQAVYIGTITRLPEGEFAADVYRYRLDLSYSPRLSWNNLVQFDNFSQQLGWFSRIRWTLEPDNDVFLVMSKRLQRDTATHEFSTLSTDLAAKVGWTFRF